MTAGEQFVVIGGGFAGLSAATALAEAGARVLVLEARPTLGGRATAFVDPVTGERVDNGQHVLFGCYHETFRFLRRIGTSAEVELQPSLAIDVIDENRRATRMSCPRLPAPFHLLVGILRWRALSIADRIAVLRMRRPLREVAYPAAGLKTRPTYEKEQYVGRAFRPGVTQVPKTRPTYEEETVRQWLERHGQTPRLITLLWEPLAVAALNESIDVAAARPFAQVLAALFGSDAQGASLGLPRTPLDELYALPAQRYIESHAGSVRCGAKARVIVGDGPIPALAVSVAGETIAAAGVVVATPWHALDDAFETPPIALRGTLDRAAAVKASSIVTVNLWLDHALPTGPFVGLPGRTFQWMFDKRALLGAGSSHLSMVASGADSIVGKSNDEIAALAWAELVSALPALRSVVPRRSVVVRERRATFSVAPDSPKRPSVYTGVPGLFLAGDWIETALPATIEGAVVSGHLAATALLERIAQSPS